MRQSHGARRWVGTRRIQAAGDTIGGRGAEGSVMEEIGMAIDGWKEQASRHGGYTISDILLTKMGALIFVVSLAVPSCYLSTVRGTPPAYGHSHQLCSRTHRP